MDASRSAATISAVIPALNEERNIGWVLRRLPAEVDEVVVVDGRSTDNTVAAALRVRPDAKIVCELAPGKGAALRAGFARSTGDMIVMLDADGSMEPGEIARFLAMLEEGYDLVKGSRFLPNGGTTDISRVRSIGNLTLAGLTNLMYRSAFTELCYGFMAFRRSALERLCLSATGFEIEAQIVAHALRAGLRIAEVPSFEAQRLSGTSNLRTVRDGSRVLRELLADRICRWPPPATQPLHEPLVAVPSPTNEQPPTRGWMSVRHRSHVRRLLEAEPVGADSASPSPPAA